MEGIFVVVPIIAQSDKRGLNVQRRIMLTMAYCADILLNHALEIRAKEVRCAIHEDPSFISVLRRFWLLGGPVARSGQTGLPGPERAGFRAST